MQHSPKTTVDAKSPRDAVLTGMGLALMGALVLAIPILDLTRGEVEDWCFGGPCDRPSARERVDRKPPSDAGRLVLAEDLRVAVETDSTPREAAPPLPRDGGQTP